MSREFKLPDLGEGIAEAQIIRVMIQPGERIEEDQSLMEVETDKAAVEIPSPFAGIAEAVHVAEGQTVNVGDVIVTFDDGRAADSASDGKKPPEKEARRTEPEPRHQPQIAPGGRRDAEDRREPQDGSPARRTSAAAAPAVRKLARELGVDLDQVAGSGPGGRVSREDVERHAAGKSKESAMTTARPPKPSAPLPGVKDADKWGPVRKAPLSQIRKTIAQQMARSAFTAAHVTHGDDADITQLERWRKQLNEATQNDPKITPMTLVIRALCLSLRKHPIFNSSFDEESGQIIYKDYVNMGIAVDTDRGLIVPVMRNADQLSLRQIAVELRSIADRVRGRQFDIEDLRGGSFTITNVGALGGTFSTPIINYPEVAILGVNAIRAEPRYVGDELQRRQVMNLSVSVDHRIADGHDAALFVQDLARILESADYPDLFGEAGEEA